MMMSFTAFVFGPSIFVDQWDCSPIDFYWLALSLINRDFAKRLAVNILLRTVFNLEVTQRHGSAELTVLSISTLLPTRAR